MATKKSTAGRGRTRNFATMVYPDSKNTPENWLDLLGEFAVPAFVSPLHDMDVNPTGEVKKAHYHVMIMFEGVKTVDQAKEVFAPIGGVGCEPVQSVRAYARYLCHLDNPDKAKYKPEDVRCFGGADYTTTIGLPTDKYKAIGEMIDYCEQYNVLSYSELLVYCRMERFDWFRVLCDNGTVVIKEYLKSRSWSAKERIRQEMDDLWKAKVEVMRETGVLKDE